jgi:hypothetical protein
MPLQNEQALQANASLKNLMNDVYSVQSKNSAHMYSIPDVEDRAARSDPSKGMLIHYSNQKFDEGRSRRSYRY